MLKKPSKTITITALGGTTLFIATLPLALGAAAQPASPAGVETQEVIVTANRLAQPLGETLAASTVFTLEEIEASQAVSLFDLLAGAPGIQMARTGGQGAQTSLFLRGTNSDHTLILIDGVKANTASEGFARLENIPVAHSPACTVPTPLAALSRYLPNRRRAVMLMPGSAATSAQRPAPSLPTSPAAAST